MAEQKKRKKKASTNKYSYYETSESSVNRKNQFCPRCGPGTFLATHAGRRSCGKCGYTEFSKE